MKNPYSDLEKKLELNHLYFNRMVEVKKGGDVVYGLSQYCAPILRDMRMEAVRKVVKDGYSVQYINSTSEIEIRKK